MDQLQRFRQEIARALGSRSAVSVAKSAGLPRLAIRQALTISEPKLGRAAEIAEAVGLEIRIGPARSASSDEQREQSGKRLDQARSHLREASECLKRADEALDEQN